MSTSTTTLLQQMDMGSLMCAQMRVHAVHTKGSQAQTSLHKSWLRGTEKLPLTLLHQGIEPRVFGIEFWRTNHWATYIPHPVQIIWQGKGYLRLCCSRFSKQWKGMLRRWWTEASVSFKFDFDSHSLPARSCFPCQSSQTRRLLAWRKNSHRLK